MKSNSSDAESSDPTAQNLEASVSPANLSGSSYGCNGSTQDVDADRLSRDKEDVLQQLSDLNDQMEAKKLEVEGFSRKHLERMFSICRRHWMCPTLFCVNNTHTLLCSASEVTLDCRSPSMSS